MDSKMEQLGKEAARLKNLLHGMVDRLSLCQLEEVYRFMKQRYFPNMF